MIRFDTFVHRYLVVCGNVFKYADTLGEAQTMLKILQFGEKLHQVLK